MEKHLVFYSDAYKVHHISATIRPTVPKFCMQLPYGISMRIIFGFVNFQFLSGFPGFVKNTRFYRAMLMRFVISRQLLRPTVPKFAIQFSYGIISMRYLLNFFISNFWVFFRFFLTLSFLDQWL